MHPVELLASSVDTVRTRLDDLQAEIEASARCAEQMHVDAATLDPHVVDHARRMAEFRALIDRIAELRCSIGEQRTLLRDIRASIDQVRRSARELRGGG